jgi:hypothetical protein
MRESYSNLYIQTATPQFSIQALKFRMVQFLPIQALPVDILTYIGSTSQHSHLYIMYRLKPVNILTNKGSAMLQFLPTKFYQATVLAYT